MPVEYQFSTLADFLASAPLTVDGQIDDGWGATLSVKGREIEATVVFFDMGGFSHRTRDLTAVETLVYVNHFFTWVSAEGLHKSKGIVDKYIGDEMMLVFSREFGSDDPFREAIQTCAKMAERDAWSFSPHIGVASGKVIVGYVGTPKKCDCSVLGAPVTLAKRCASINPESMGNWSACTWITLPAVEWADRDLSAILPRKQQRRSDGSLQVCPPDWELRPARNVNMRGFGNAQVRDIIKTGLHFPSCLPEEQAKEAVKELKKSNRYWPR